MSKMKWMRDMVLTEPEDGLGLGQKGDMVSKERKSTSTDRGRGRHRVEFTVKYPGYLHSVPEHDLVRNRKSLYFTLLFHRPEYNRHVLIWKDGPFSGKKQDVSVDATSTMEANQTYLSLCTA